MNTIKSVPLRLQITCLRVIFPQLAIASVDEGLLSKELPTDATARLAIPRWQAIAPTYTEAVYIILGLLETRMRVEKAYWNNNFDPNQGWYQAIPDHDHREGCYTKLSAQQAGHDILIVPVRFASRKPLDVTMFDIGAFAGGVTLLTHPELLGNGPREVWISDAGSVCIDPLTEDQWNSTPSLSLDRFVFDQTLVATGCVP